MTQTYIIEGQWEQLGPDTWGFLRDDPKFDEALASRRYASRGVTDRETYLTSAREYINGTKRNFFIQYKGHVPMDGPGSLSDLPSPLSVIVEVIPPGGAMVPGTDRTNNNKDGKTFYRVIHTSPPDRFWERYENLVIDEEYGIPYFVENAYAARGLSDIVMPEEIQQCFEHYPKPPFL